MSGGPWRRPAVDDREDDPVIGLDGVAGDAVAPDLLRRSEGDPGCERKFEPDRRGWLS